MTRLALVRSRGAALAREGQAAEGQQAARARQVAALSDLQHVAKARELLATASAPGVTLFGIGSGV